MHEHLTVLFHSFTRELGASGKQLTSHTSPSFFPVWKCQFPLPYVTITSNIPWGKSLSYITLVPYVSAHPWPSPRPTVLQTIALCFLPEAVSPLALLCPQRRAQTLLSVPCNDSRDEAATSNFHYSLVKVEE